MNSFANSDLLLVLNQLAQNWTIDAEAYGRWRPNAKARERAFWFGMSCGFADSTNELLKLIRQPTVQGAIALAHLLNRRQAQAARRFPYRRKALNIKAHTFGAAEAYRRCADNLMRAPVEIFCDAAVPVDYLC